MRPRPPSHHLVHLSIFFFGLVFTAGLAVPSRAVEVTKTIDVKFKSSTTLQKPADSFVVQVLRDSTALINLDLEVRPIQGTFTIEYDNQLKARYEDSTVSQGGPRVDVKLDWIYTLGNLGRARLRQGYYIRPLVETRLDRIATAFGWSAVADSLPAPSDGNFVLRRPAVAAAPLKIEIVDDRVLGNADAPNAAVLGGSISPFGGQYARADSQTIQLSVVPYPCLRIDLDMIARLDYQWSYRNAEVCVRYSSDPADTNCWAAADSFRCIDSLRTVTIPVDIGCEAVRHKIIPFCPVTAQGELTLSVQLELEVNSYSLAYDCLDISPSPPAFMTSTGSPVDTLIASQTLAVNRADDDAIYVIDVPGTQPAITSPSAGSSVVEGDNLTIQWDPTLPTDVLACCSDSLLVDLFYDVTDTTRNCNDAIVARTPNDGQYTWAVPTSIPCTGTTTDYVITAVFYCANPTGREVPLAHSQSGGFNITSAGGP